MVSMSTYGLPRSRRIGAKREIDRVFRKGRSIAGPLIRVHILPNGTPQSRLAISAPRKVGGAVQRNRWKRLIREAFRLNRHGVGAGLDVVVVPLVGPGEIKRPQVEDALMGAIVAYRRARG
jgi:ribonuclease P protein component